MSYVGVARTRCPNQRHSCAEAAGPLQAHREGLLRRSGCCARSVRTQSRLEAGADPLFECGPILRVDLGDETMAIVGFLQREVPPALVCGQRCGVSSRRHGVSVPHAVEKGAAQPKLYGTCRLNGSLCHLVPYETFLIQTVETEPAITMPQLAARLLEQHGIVATPAMLSRFLCRRGLSYKKVPHGGGVRTRRRA